AGTLEEAAAAAARVEERVRGNGRVVDALVLTDPAECARLWRVREGGAGFASRWIDGTQTGGGWEGSGGAPERLADYLAELLELVNRYGYRAIAYGHFGAGCIHLRLDSDLRTERGRRSFESFMHEAAALVVAHGGSLSGEHGDGRARSELL